MILDGAGKGTAKQLCAAALLAEGKVGGPQLDVTFELLQGPLEEKVQATHDGILAGRIFLRHAEVLRDVCRNKLENRSYWMYV